MSDTQLIQKIIRLSIFLKICTLNLQFSHENLSLKQCDDASINSIFHKYVTFHYSPSYLILNAEMLKKQLAIQKKILDSLVKSFHFV